MSPPAARATRRRLAIAAFWIGLGASVAFVRSIVIDGDPPVQSIVLGVLAALLVVIGFVVAVFAGIAGSGLGTATAPGPGQPRRLARVESMARGGVAMSGRRRLVWLELTVLEGIEAPRRVTFRQFVEASALPALAAGRYVVVAEEPVGDEDGPPRVVVDTAPTPAWTQRASEAHTHDDDVTVAAHEVSETRRRPARSPGEPRRGPGWTLLNLVLVAVLLVVGAAGYLALTS